MRVVIFGATGNVGTGVLRALSGDENVGEIAGFARQARHNSVADTDQG